jgi:hypothetical protein
MSTTLALSSSHGRRSGLLCAILRRLTAWNQPFVHQRFSGRNGRTLVIESNKVDDNCSAIATVDCLAQTRPLKIADRPLACFPDGDDNQHFGPMLERHY